MGKKLTFEEVKNRVNEAGYKLITKEYEYLLSNQKLTVVDNLGYLYSSLLSNIKPNKTLERFNTCNPYTIQNIKLWCKINNKPFKLLDSQIYIGSEEKLKWKCFKENCGEIFNMPWRDVYQGHGCGVCHGFQTGLSNCLATVNPELAKEWHPTLNGDLTPFDVTSNSHKIIWWQCKDNPKHEWQIDIHNRNSRNSGCPYCSGRYPTEDNNLLINNPEMCEEWDYVKNNIRPEECTPYSRHEVWWKCRDCGHEWSASIGSRNTKDAWCPECNKSKGEKEIDNVLLDKNLIKISQEEFDLLGDIDKYNKNYFIPQKTFSDLFGTGGGLLSYDHFIPKFNLLIEFQGMQHEKFVEWIHKSIRDFEKQQEHDRRKKEYALQNGYNFLEIWYYDKNNIEEILKNYIEI